MEETTVSNEVEAPVQATEAQNEPETEEPEQDSKISQDKVNDLIGSAKRKAREQGYQQGQSEMMEQMQAKQQSQPNHMDADTISINKVNEVVEQRLAFERNQRTRERGTKKYGAHFEDNIADLVTKANRDSDLREVLEVASRSTNPEGLLHKLSTDEKSLKEMLDKKSSRLGVALAELSRNLDSEVDDKPSRTVKNPAEPIKDLKVPPKNEGEETQAQRRAYHKRRKLNNW